MIELKASGHIGVDETRPYDVVTDWKTKGGLTMKEKLIKYLCVGLVWVFLIVVACVCAHFYDLDATFFLVAWLCFLTLKRDYEQKNENDGNNEN